MADDGVLRYQDMIDAQAKIVRAMIEGKTVMGKTVDPNNVNDLIVAAYFLGRLQADEAHGDVHVTRYPRGYLFSGF